MPTERPARRRDTGVWHRLKGLITGGPSELEAERNSAYETAKIRLQQCVEEGKMTVQELDRQLVLLRASCNGHHHDESSPA